MCFGRAMVQYRILCGDRFLPWVYCAQLSQTRPLGTLVLHLLSLVRQTPPGFKQALQILPLSFSCRSFRVIPKNTPHWYSSWARLLEVGVTPLPKLHQAVVYSVDLVHALVSVLAPHLDMGGLLQGSDGVDTLFLQFHLRLLYHWLQ